MGSPSVYVLTLLVNKKAAFGQWLNRIKPGWKRCRESRQSQEKPCSHPQETDTSTRACWNFAGRSQPRSDTHRLMEMG